MHTTTMATRYFLVMLLSIAMVSADTVATNPGTRLRGTASSTTETATGTRSSAGFVSVVHHKPLRHLSTTTATDCAKSCSQDVANGGAWTFDTAMLQCSCFSTKSSYTVEQKDFWISSGALSSRVPDHLMHHPPVAAPVCESFNNTAVNGTVACGTSNVVSADACCSFCNSRCSNFTTWAYNDATGCFCYSNVTAVTQKAGWRASGMLFAAH